VITIEKLWNQSVCIFVRLDKNQGFDYWLCPFTVERDIGMHPEMSQQKFGIPIF
jgi:hypothetical protein